MYGFGASMGDCPSRARSGAALAAECPVKPAIVSHEITTRSDVAYKQVYKSVQTGKIGFHFCVRMLGLGKPTDETTKDVQVCQAGELRCAVECQAV